MVDEAALMSLTTDPTVWTQLTECELTAAYSSATSARRADEYTVFKTVPYAS